jgi:hypothetical protein
MQPMMEACIMATSKRSTKAKSWPPKDLDLASVANSKTRTDKFFRNLKKQPPVLIEEDISRIEREISIEIRARKGALAFLCQPFREVTESCDNDREWAVTLATLSHAAQQSAEFHKELASLLESASFRMKLALSGREDMRAVLEEGRSPESVSERGKVVALRR